MIELKNKKYIGSDNRTSVYDISLPKEPKAMVIFAHGYKGYKDWGPWNQVQDFFVKQNYGFIKFNFSHNGGTAEDSIDFPDLDAFGQNNYCKELFDLDKITLLTESILKERELNIPIFLIGHSRGGGMVIIHGSADKRINKVVSWAGISNIEARFPLDDELDDWRTSGMRYVQNGRTKQLMPHHYSMYENYLDNKEKLNIQLACENMRKPFVQIHGDMDLAVSISEGLLIAKWTETNIEIIKGAGHTFETKHPWDSNVLPEDMQVVLDKTLMFFEE